MILTIVADKESLSVSLVEFGVYRKSALEALYPPGYVSVNRITSIGIYRMEPDPLRSSQTGYN